MASKSSRRWLREHFTDPYVKQAQLEGYRSRAIYKLMEIHERDRLFKPGMVVVDLGAAPGGWSQYVARLVKPHGQVIALDLLPMDDIPGVTFLQGDFADDQVVETLLASLPQVAAQPVGVDWVISDMAPNMSGVESVDIPRAMYLAECALDFALKVIKPEGGLVIKVFQGEGFDSLLKALKQQFKQVVIRKPKASRDRSRELYLVAKGRKG